MVLCLLRYFGAKDSEGRQTAGELRWLVLAGIFMTCDVLAYPSMVLVFCVAWYFCWCADQRKNGKNSVLMYCPVWQVRQ